MSYKYSKGAQVIGDLKAADDTERDTLIDFGEDTIDFKTSGSSVLKVSGSDVYLTDGSNIYLGTDSNIFFDGYDTIGDCLISQQPDNQLLIDGNNQVRIDADEQVRIQQNFSLKADFNFTNDEFRLYMPMSSSSHISASSFVFADSVKIAGAPAGQDTVIDSNGNFYGDTIDVGTVSASNIVVTDGVGGVEYQFPVSDGTSGQALTTDGAGNLTFSTISGGGTGSTSPAGSDTQIQFNNAGAFGASANLTYDGSELELTGNFRTEGSLFHEDYNRTIYPAHASNGNDVDLQRSYVKEFYYSKYDWAVAFQDFFTIEPYDTRTSLPYTGSNMVGVVLVNVDVTGYYNDTSEIYSGKVLYSMTWNGTTRASSAHPYTQLVSQTTFKTHFQSTNTGSNGRTFQFGYQTAATTGPMNMFFRVQTGWPAGSDAQYIYWVFTEHFTG